MAKCPLHQGRGRPPKDCAACAAGAAEKPIIPAKPAPAPPQPPKAVKAARKAPVASRSGLETFGPHPRFTGALLIHSRPCETCRRATDILIRDRVQCIFCYKEG